MRRGRGRKTVDEIELLNETSDGHAMKYTPARYPRKSLFKKWGRSIQKRLQTSRSTVHSSVVISNHTFLSL